MTKLTATIITLNEEDNLDKCLSSIEKLVDEIVVVDSGSKDKTLQIAKKYNAKIFTRDFDNYADQKNYADNKATGEWIFSIDADEQVTPQLVNEITKAIQTDIYDGYLIPRKNILLGEEIKHTRWSPDKHIWLWKKDRGEWVGDIHEEVMVKGKVGELVNAKIHHSYKSVSEFFQMLNIYTTKEAEYKIKNKIKFSWFRLFWDPALSFTRRYFYKLGFLDGWRGFVLSYLMAIYRFTTWIKVWEIENR